MTDYPEVKRLSNRPGADLPEQDSETEETENHDRGYLTKTVLYLLLLTVVASFFIGDLLGENSSGSSRADFYNYYWKDIQRFAEKPWLEAITTYTSATNPLLFMMASLPPFANNQKIYHLITFIAALLTWPLLSWAYFRRYAKHNIDFVWASFGASAILLLPSFRSSAFWGATDYVPILFCAATSLLLSRIQDVEGEKVRALGVLTLLALSMVSASAFYVRQYYAFLPAIAAWTVLNRTTTPRFLVLSVFAVVMVPELLLIWMWKGLNPPAARYFHPTMTNVLVAGAIIGLLSIPLVIGCIRRSVSDVLPAWWGTRSTVIAFGGLLAFIIAEGATSWPGAGGGGGIIVKAGLWMGGLGTPFILSVSYFGFLAAIIFSIRSATNALLASVFLLPYFVSAVVFQHYLETPLAVSVFLFSDTQTAKTVFNKRVLVCNFAFSAILLVAGIIYYDLFPELLN